MFRRRNYILTLTGGHPTQMTPDPIAAKVLGRGEALPAQAGRADDFSWPRSDNGVTATPEALSQPVALAPATPGKKDTTAMAYTEKTTASKDVKAKSTTRSDLSKTRQAPHADLDGAPIPPAPVGSR
jgi:hypothetical protein